MIYCGFWIIGAELHVKLDGGMFFLHILTVLVFDLCFSFTRALARWLIMAPWRVELSDGDIWWLWEKRQEKRTKRDWGSAICIKKNRVLFGATFCAIFWCHWWQVLMCHTTSNYWQKLSNCSLYCLVLFLFLLVCWKANERHSLWLQRYLWLHHAPKKCATSLLNPHLFLGFEL